MSTGRLRLGQLLVDARVLTEEQLEGALARQKTDGRRLGTLLVEMGLVNETQLTQILSQQLNAPWVSLYHIEFSRQLLNLVPREVAEKYCLVPIYVRVVRGQGNTLYVAMDDPSNEEALRECAMHSQLPARAMIAPPSDIWNAIRVYYGARSSMASIPDGALLAAVAEAAQTAKIVDVQKSVPPPQSIPATVVTSDRPPPPVPQKKNPALTATMTSAGTPTRVSQPPPPPESVRPPPPESVRPPPPPSRPPANASPEIDMAAAVAAPTRELSPSQFDVDEDAPEITMGLPRSLPVPAPKKGPRMVSLTLLDGTTITLPAKKKEHQREPTPELGDDDVIEGGPPGEATQLTARDLVAALRAVSHGADASEILGQNARWESLFAALLSLLLKKHLIADWEFIEEFKKI